MSRICIAFFWLFLSLSFSQNVEMERELNQYFSKLVDEFDEITSNIALRSVSLEPANKYFKSVLKKHPYIHSISRINSKGVVVNQITQKGKKGAKIKKAAINQRWFRTLKESGEPYYGLKKNNGRVYLFWANPLFLSQKNEKTRFAGAIVAKIDVKNEINEFAEGVNKPFYIKIGHAHFMDYHWQANRAFVSKKLEIPGVPQVKIHYSLAAEAAENGAKTENSK